MIFWMDIWNKKKTCQWMTSPRKCINERFPRILIQYVFRLCFTSTCKDKVRKMSQNLPRHQKVMFLPATQAWFLPFFLHVIYVKKFQAKENVIHTIIITIMIIIERKRRKKKRRRWYMDDGKNTQTHITIRMSLEPIWSRTLVLHTCRCV